MGGASGECHRWFRVFGFTLVPVCRSGCSHQPNPHFCQLLLSLLLVAALGRPRRRVRRIAPQRPRNSQSGCRRCRGREEPPGGIILPVCQNLTPLACDMCVGLQVAGELLDLQKLPATSDRCVFTGLRAGSLYRLQVVSWSRDMSSDSATLARTGQSTCHVKPCCTAPWWINVTIHLLIDIQRGGASSDSAFQHSCRTPWPHVCTVGGSSPVVT